MTPQKYSIYKRKDRNTYTVQWRSDGKYVKKRFKTKKEAEKFVAERKREQSEHGNYTVSQEERTLLALAREQGMTIDDLRQFILSYRPKDELTNIDIQQSIDAFLAHCDANRIRPHTRNHYNTMLSAFAHKHKGYRINQLTVDLVVRFILDRYSNNNSRLTCRTPICAWLRWAGMESIASKVVWSQPKQDEHRVQLLSPNEADALIRAHPAKYKPGCALKMFAGIRPEEMQRMDWNAVRWKQRVIDIDGPVAKTRAFRRLHNLPDNLWAWLESAKIKEGPIIPCNHRNAKEATRKARIRAGIDSWPKDAMRHSFASYGYHRGLEWAVDTMGHVAGFRTFVRHYKGAASAEDAERYFSIAP